MRAANLLVRFPLATALAVAPFAGLGAQANSPSGPPAPAATNASVAKPGLKKLDLDDYSGWNRIGSTALSRDGKWMTFTYTPNESGDPVLHVKSLDGDKDYVIPLGAVAGGGRAGAGRGGAPGGGNGGAPSFSDDSRWAAYMVNPPGRAGGGAGRGRGAPAPGGRGAGQGAQAPATPGRLELLNLATGEKSSIPNAGSWKFSATSRWIAVRFNRPQAAAANGATGAAGGGGAAAGPASTGADLILRDLAAGTDLAIGNVNQYEFDDSGKLFAYTVDAAEKFGNGVYVLDPATGTTRALNTGPAIYDALAWSNEGTNLVALRGDKSKELRQRENVLLAWSGLAMGAGKAFVFDPSKDPSFPKGMVVSEYATPRWSADGARLFIGLKEQEPEIPAADSIKANVDIFHWKDVVPQPVQIVQIAQTRRATYPAALTVSTGTFVRLGDEMMRTVANAANNAVGVGRSDTAYRGEIAWGTNRADFFKVDLNTGARTPIEKGLSRTYGTSPDSKWFLYLKNKQTLAYNLETGKSVTLDASIIPGKSYVNDDDDHAYEKPIWGVGGWTRDGKSVLLYDKFDVWQAPLDGGKPTNLTQGVGRAQQIQFRVTRFGAGGGGRGGRGGGGGAAADSDGVDLSLPVTLSAYGDRTKKTGYWKVTAGQAPTPIIWADKAIGGVVKAANADRLIYTEQDFDEFPDYWATNSAFASPKRVTDANPILKEYAWSPKKVLVDYTTSKGHKLQGTLMLPAGYEPGKRYPMLVEFYEIMSNTHHNFSTPGYSNSPQLSTYASNGYLVFQPDIVYEIGTPGTSAVDCMTSAVKKVIELGYADPKHIGLHGHSWSGYQSSYIVTQTDMFAAVVTGAPPTNLISFYDELYKSAGTPQQGITTVGQVRMGANVTPWNSTKLYEDQSPIFHVNNIKTPFMILQGMDDGAVDYVEGLQFFNAARAAGKQVILLSYPGEAHNLTNRDNQKDFTIRMKQFFDHYLMGAPMPQWMADGLPQTKKGGPIK
jgi:dienelactone hydrolase